MLIPPKKTSQPFSSTRIAGPLVEPVEAAEVRDYLRLPDTGQDAQLTRFILESREYIEAKSGLAGINQTWKLGLDHWFSKHEPWWDGEYEGHINTIHGHSANGVITLPVYPLVSVDSITVYDTGRVATSVPVAETFIIDTYSRPGRMSLDFGKVWPIATQTIKAIEINYTAGFGADADAVPELFKAGIVKMAAYLTDNRFSCDLSEAYTKSGARSSIDLLRGGTLK